MNITFPLYENVERPSGSQGSAPFSSDKIRAKILDLGYGGARRALHNLCPKSARILSGNHSHDLAPRRG